MDDEDDAAANGGPGARPRDTARLRVLVAGMAIIGVVVMAMLLGGRSGTVDPGVPARVELGRVESLISQWEEAGEKPLTDDDLWGSSLAVVIIDDPDQPLDNLYESSLYATVSDGLYVFVLSTHDPHRGFIVHWCSSLNGFQSYRHGSTFDELGEYLGGPSPRGLDRYPVSISDDGLLIADLTRRVPGPDRDTSALEANHGRVCRP